MMSTDLDVLLEKAKRVAMSDNDKQAQRRSFAFGNASFENPDITRQMIDEIDATRNPSAA